MPDTPNIGLTLPSNTGSSTNWLPAQLADAARIDALFAGCVVKRTTSVAVPYNDLTFFVPWEAEEIPAGRSASGMWVIGSATHITILADGYYDVLGQAVFVDDATGHRNLVLMKNTATVLAEQLVIPPPAGFEAGGSVQVWREWLVAGDYLRLQLYQKIAGATTLALFTTAGRPARMMVKRSGG